MFLEFPGEGTWLIGRISEKLMMRKMFLGTAESCTGGLASVLCTNVPGSSQWFRGSVVPYDNSLKTALLRVPAHVLDEHGAVSAPVVEAMAAGVLEVLGADVGVAISGIAGPDGGSTEKPVGTVWIATAVRPSGATIDAASIVSFSRVFPGDRNDIRFGAALGALGAVDAALGSLGVE